MPSICSRERPSILQMASLTLSNRPASSASAMPTVAASYVAASLSSLSRRASSASYASVTSVVKQRVLTNLPFSTRLFDVMNTCFSEPSFARSRAGNRRSSSPHASFCRISPITGASTWNSAMCRPTYSSSA